MVSLISKITFNTLILFSFFKCNSQNRIDSIRSQLIDTWYSSASKNIELKFTQENKYILLQNNDVALINAHFKIEPSKDEIWIKIIDQFDTIKCLYYILEDKLVQINFKKGIGIDNHIDEIGVFLKKQNQKFESTQLCQSCKTANYLLPSDFRGSIFISFNPSSSHKLNLDSILVQRISKNGILESDYNINISRFIDRKFKFFQEDLNSEKKIELEVIDIFKRFTEEELNKIDPNKVFILPIGYNQGNRDELNSIFGKNIVGNIECYEVNTFKNLRKIFFPKE